MSDLEYKVRRFERTMYRANMTNDREELKALRVDALALASEIWPVGSATYRHIDRELIALEMALIGGPMPGSLAAEMAKLGDAIRELIESVKAECRKGCWPWRAQ